MDIIDIIWIIDFHSHCHEFVFVDIYYDDKNILAEIKVFH